MASTGRRSTAALLASALVGCGSEAPFVSDPNSSVPHATAGDPTAPISLDGVTGELVITRQRDLLDSGPINVMSRNGSAVSLLLSNVELVADTFDSEPAATRTINVGAGRQVAIQVPYGAVADCDAMRPVGAEPIFTYASDDDPSLRAGLRNSPAPTCSTRSGQNSAQPVVSRRVLGHVSMAPRSSAGPWSPNSSSSRSATPSI